jgi:hypothetical protein
MRRTVSSSNFGYSGYISAVRLVKLPSENLVSELANAGIPVSEGLLRNRKEHCTAIGFRTLDTLQ